MPGAKPLPIRCIEEKLMDTPKGLMKCKVADFDPQKYRGINYNTRTRNKRQPKK